MFFVLQGVSPSLPVQCLTGTELAPCQRPAKESFLQSTNMLLKNSCKSIATKNLETGTECI